MPLSKELLFLILQFCDEENLKKTAHMLELETAIFFDMKYFEDLVLGGQWDEAERYLSGFTGVEDNKYSIKMYFEIRKQHFLEALDMHERTKALDILVKDLKVFAPSNEELYKEMTQLLTLDDIRQHSSLSSYGDILSARKHMMSELKYVIEANPLFHGKLKLPQINGSRLRRLVNQGLNWQHIHCTYPQPEPEIKTLYIDHQCPMPDNPYGKMNEDNKSSKVTSELTSPCSKNSYSNSSSRSHHSVISNAAAPTNGDATVEDSDNESKSTCTRTLAEVKSTGILPTEDHKSVNNIPDSLPKTIARIFSLSSSPTCMDFHPVFQTFLLAGTSAGDIELWEVISREKLLSRKFGVWKISIASLENLVKDPLVSVNRVLWSPDGSLFGVAHSKHIVQLYSYHGGSCIKEKLEIDAHFGGVNDLAFSKQNDELFLVTCGDDKLVKVWDVKNGITQYTFEGHGSPVYSICTHWKENVHFLFSTSINGEIRAWLYDNVGARVTYVAPGNGCTRMAYSADGKRLFSCGTNEHGESSIVEWKDTEGYIMKSYVGVQRCTAGVLQFDMSKNGFLAAGDNHAIKVWDIDNVELLASIDADEGLPVRPYIRFNRTGTLLAVSANNNKIILLANNHGLQLLKTSNFHDIAAFEVLPESLRKDEGTDNLESMEPESPALPRDREVQTCETSGKSHCQSSRLPFEGKTNKISRLIYTHNANAILALAVDGAHLLWKWSKSDTNLTGQATTKVSPQLWQPKTGFSMTSNLTDNNSATVMPCVALSKNNSYLVSALGGPVSLLNVMTFKKMKSFCHPQPAATCIAFYPYDNNIIAVGMDDSTILLYNARSDKIMNKLQGHSKRVTSLAFSNKLNILVSSAMNAQIVIWDTVGWVKKESTNLGLPYQWSTSELPETHVQFHEDQRHFLVVHESQLAIYEMPKLELVKQWVAGEICTRISHATFSCNSQYIYACLLDGKILIFTSSDLRIQWEINPSDYLPSDISLNVYPLVIAANPKEPNQFALGLTDGGVVVLEPPEPECEWGTLPPPSVHKRGACF